jgi:hypothetical protein
MDGVNDNESKVYRVVSEGILRLLASPCLLNLAWAAEARAGWAVGRGREEAEKVAERRQASWL